MNRNQKIALGCGGAGCLGLIVVTLAAALIYWFSYRETYRASSDDWDYNVNSSSDANTNSNDSSSDANENENDNSSSSTSSSTASSITEDDKHKLFHAASMTGDPELIRRVQVKIGIMDDDYTPGANYQDFVASHVGWALRNTDFIRSLDTQEKARAYVNEHFPD